jgi:hypothetical protein
MRIQTKIHDGIIAGFNVLSIVLAVKVDIRFLWIAAAVSAVMISSVFTGFCPLHYTVNRILPPKSLV